MCARLNAPSSDIRALPRFDFGNPHWISSRPQLTRRFTISQPNNNQGFINRPFANLGSNGQASRPQQGASPQPARPQAPGGAPRPAFPAGPRPQLSGPIGPRPQGQGGSNFGSRPQGQGGPPFNRGNDRNRGRYFDQTRVNERIRAPRVRVVDGNDDHQLGIMLTPQAIRIARERGLDLVEVAPNADPPVCKIVDYGKYKYIQEKHKKEAHKHAKSTKVKELKFRVGIDPHDYLIKMVHAEEFLAEGHKVRVQLQFRGRQMAHQDLGFELLGRIKKDLLTMAHVDSEPKQAGRNINMQLSPLPERQRVRKFNHVKKGKLIDPDEDHEDDENDHHEEDHQEEPGPAKSDAEAAHPPKAPLSPHEVEQAAEAAMR